MEVNQECDPLACVTRRVSSCPTVARTDVELLADLSHGSVSPSRLDILTRQQAQLLAHALSCESTLKLFSHTHTLQLFSVSSSSPTVQKVQTVVYCTRSLHPEENDQLVKRVLEKTHTHPKLLPFR